MNAMNILMSSEILRSIGWTLLHSLWQGALVLILATLLLWLFRRHSPVVRYNILCVALVMIFFSSIITFITLQGSDTTPGPVNPAVAVVAGYAGPAERDIAPASSMQQWTSDKLAALGHLIEQNSHYLALFWLFGFLFFLVRYLGGLYYIGHLRRKGLIRVNPKWIIMAGQLAQNTGIRKRVDIFESLSIRVPLTLGYIKPIILFPAGMLGSIPPEQVEAILMHEMAHILRRDYLVNALQSLVEAVFFYHPAVWLISERIRTERENICDDIAIHHTNDKLNYIKALTNMENLTSKTPALMHSFSGKKKQLLYRVRRMVNIEGRKIRPVEGLVTFFVLVTLAILLGAGANMNTSKAGTTFVAGYPAINADAINSLSNTPPAPTGQGVVDDWNTLYDPGQGVDNIANAPIAAPDTADKTKQEQFKVQQQQEEAREKALQKLEEAETMKQEAMEAYRDALKDYHETMKDLRMEEWKENFKWVVADSLDTTIMIIGPHHKGMYIFSDKDSNDIILEDFYGFNYPDPGKYEYSYQFRRPDRAKIYRDMDNPEIIIRKHGKDLYWNDEIEREIEQEYKWIQKDLQDNQREIEKRIVVPSPDIRVRAPRVEPFFFLEKERTPEHIIRQELVDDMLIRHGKDYIVEMGPNGMYINGEKQSRDVFRKYKKIYEGITGEEMAVTVKMVF